MSAFIMKMASNRHVNPYYTRLWRSILCLFRSFGRLSDYFWSYTVRLVVSRRSAHSFINEIAVWRQRQTTGWYDWFLLLSSSVRRIPATEISNRILGRIYILIGFCLPIKHRMCNDFRFRRNNWVWPLQIDASDAASWTNNGNFRLFYSFYRSNAATICQHFGKRRDDELTHHFCRCMHNGDRP